MLPIALTCPLWWVARWTARMLASLAVVVACSLGAATLPVGGAAPAASGPVDAAAVRTGSPDLALGFAWSATGSSDAVTGAPARAGAGASDPDPAAAADRQFVPAPAAPRPAGIVPGERHPVLVGLLPATVGSRAPPAR
ncbi:hypothetical protein [Micromonospora sp. NPDC005806]|uniref:hypothetical protein n=1 Tax=Micromonospora sp. NPDC005806 TaxID=3364234 RepID=UPI00368DE5CE